MRTLRLLTSAALLCAPAFAAPADTMMVRKVHTEAGKMGQHETPAKDETQTVWIAKDRVRVESDDKIILLRLDQKKLYMMDPKEKTYSPIDLPFDMKKYLPAEMAEMYDKMNSANTMSCKVTPTDETKKIKDWNTKKYELKVTGSMTGGMTEEVWVTKDISVDTAAFLELLRTTLTMRPGGESMVDELKKIDGVPVMSDRTLKSPMGTVKTHEELVSIEQKDAPAGAFELPKDYKETPFNPMMMGGRRPPESKGPPPQKQ
jgi:hypothetical protein